jgi:serine protease AprX
VNGAALAAPGARPSLDKSARVHPKLQYGAQVEPNKTVRVLVQKLNTSLDLRSVTNNRGKGRVQEDFAQFSTSSVEILQKDVAELAKQPGVLFVSPDGALSEKKTDNSGKGSGKDDEKAEKALEAQVRALASSGPKKVKPDYKAPTDRNLLTTFNQDINSSDVWGSHGGLTGAGVTVAVLDTGVNPFHDDLDGKVFPVFVNPEATGYLDELGHGTHVAGIINGRSDGDQYVGVAPDARVISVKIADDQGSALESDMLRGMLWVYEHRADYNIKVVNLSLGAATPQSYKSSPIDAAAERLWQAGITVVASAGNRGSDKGATWFAPGNDPFVITVGCLDDNQTTTRGDDSTCTFGSRGLTQDGVVKPDLVAPGRKIVAPLAGATADLAVKYPERVAADKEHIRLSGTSMATPMVSGAAALLLQRNPNLKPDQIKWLLTTQTQSYRGQTGKTGELDVARALSQANGGVREANDGLKLSPLGTLLGLGGVSTTSAYWNNAYWNNAYWDNAYWDNAYWDNAYWDNAYWDNAYWYNAGAVD